MNCSNSWQILIKTRLGGHIEDEIATYPKGFVVSYF